MGTAWFRLEKQKPYFYHAYRVEVDHRMIKTILDLNQEGIFHSGERQNEIRKIA
jgi:hypothetical protein